MKSDQVVISARDISKQFQASRSLFARKRTSTLAVDGVSFDLHRGETIAVVGESGAGKSTVGRLVLRMIEPDSGSIHYHGEDLRSKSRSEMRRLRKHLRLIFQDPFASMDPRITVGATVSGALGVHSKLNAEERRSQSLDLFERVGLRREQFDRMPYEFSGGQLQRVAIARAISTEPEVVVCDEPVAALDMSIRAQVINLLLDLQVERGISYIFITHDLSLARLIADRVMVMRAGRVVEFADAEELFANPQDSYTRKLLAAIPNPDPTTRPPKRSAGSGLVP